MNIATYSPALTLLYVFALLWILMGVELKSFSTLNRWLILFAIAFLCIANQILRDYVGYAVYGKMLFIYMHLPTFLLFLYLAKRGIIKTAFMILTATVFTAPTVLIGNIVRNTLFVDSPQALLLSNLISYTFMLILVWFVFRSGFNYLLTYGENKLFVLFSLIPLVYYIYVFAAANQDFSALTSVPGYIVRYLPTAEVFMFYFLFPYLYKSLSEKQLLKSAQNALQQKINSAESQITLLHDSNSRMSVYRHDMRHQLIMLNGMLSSGQTEQAREFISTVMTDLDAITPKKFCENEIINLLCSFYDNKAQNTGINFSVSVMLPQNLPLSDTELCSVVSNGLENAFIAVSKEDVPDKWVKIYCEVRQNKLLIQIQNPYTGQITMRNGLPVSGQEDHGYGCYSIKTITQQNGGHSSFKAEKGLFTLRLIFPLPPEYKN
ncbi:MAG: GHKL domain-containing protein [Firmicutes bacterium]|nr:GHKL domain-containing protein [Bacillota bacterium]